MAISIQRTNLNALDVSGVCTGRSPDSLTGSTALDPGRAHPGPQGKPRTTAGTSTIARAARAADWGFKGRAASLRSASASRADYLTAGLARPRGWSGDERARAIRFVPLTSARVAQITSGFSSLNWPFQGQCLGRRRAACCRDAHPNQQHPPKQADLRNSRTRPFRTRPPFGNRMVAWDGCAVKDGNEHPVLSRCCLRISPREATTERRRRHHSRVAKGLNRAPSEALQQMWLEDAAPRWRRWPRDRPDGPRRVTATPNDRVRQCARGIAANRDDFWGSLGDMRWTPAPRSTLLPHTTTSTASMG